MMQKWVITCNLNYYDVVGAFKANTSINWKQSVDIKVGDIVYIYAGKPVSAIMFETKAVKVNLPAVTIDDHEFVIDDSNYGTYGRYMELELLRSFNPSQLQLSGLKKGGLKSVQGPSRVTSELESFIDETLNTFSLIKKRQYFFVFQNKTFNEEYRGSYLWAPQSSNSGNLVSHWSQMKNVRKGDLIIHSYLKRIVAISVAKTDVYESDRPIELPNQWETKGWRVDSEYFLIRNPIITSDHMDKLLMLQPNIDSPFNRIGRGNMEYLFRANRELAEYILRESIAVQETELEKEILIDLIQDRKYDEVEEQLDRELNDNVETMLSVYSNESTEVYTLKPKIKPDELTRAGKKYYPRDRNTSIKALIRANHKCEVDEKHPSFIRKNTNLNYTEPHHLIPMAYQDAFENSLDVEANIVALCSNCHNQIHYGRDAETLLKKLFVERSKELEEAGISVIEIDLLSLY